MTPLATDRIRVRRRPGALIAFWAWRLLAAWIVATPLVDAIGASGIGRHPHGDAALFEPGGLYLFEAARLALPSLQAVPRTTFFLLFLAAIAGLLALAGLMVALASADRLRFQSWSSAALRQFPAFLLLAGATWVLQGIVLLSAVLLFSLVQGALYQRVDERTADLGGLAAAFLVLLAGLAAGVWQDLARAAVVRHGAGAGPAVRIALLAARTSPRAAAVAWAWPAAAAVTIVVAAALLLDRIGIEKAGSTRVSLAWLVHQSTAFVLVALRATWLVAALRLVDRVLPQLSRSRQASGDRPEDSGAPADPSSDRGA